MFLHVHRRCVHYSHTTSRLGAIKNVTEFYRFVNRGNAQSSWREDVACGDHSRQAQGTYIRCFANVFKNQTLVGCCVLRGFNCSVDFFIKTTGSGTLHELWAIIPSQTYCRMSARACF